MTDGSIQSPHDAPVAFTEQQRATLKGVVDKYAAGELDRAAAVVHLTIALGNICVALKVPFSATILRPYIEELEGVDNQRGAGDGSSSGGAGGSNNKRRRDDDDEEQAPQKRQRIDYAELLRPALSADEFLDTVVSAKALLVASRVQKFSEDPKEAVRVVVNSPLAPAFPPGLWKLVLLDQYVDFNLIRANTFATEPERASELVIGDGELEVRKPRASSQITSAAQWNDAFWIYSEAVNFAFPGREQELRAYNRHINNTFSSTHDSCHHRVFKYDRALRVYIGQTRSLLLDDARTLDQIRHAHLSETGLHVVGDIERHPRQQQARERGARPKQRTGPVELCRNYNANRCALAHCKYRHACIECQGPHPACECPDKSTRRV
ncbi:C3H1-type domain-containing protein [Mycena indigotica]|uniref:C3H1-type domain-containing protein n=1 Tax=Mycena indigotica TaxID=2126181 RepID=A0A8H6SB10_9AGAR|nr:C3H1-type domain-containing protein [Mycena indigotica]KAF7295421.1 C3H1-type domain-containing protein [Mycena indigotica]